MDPFDDVNPCAAQMNYVEPRQETAQAAQRLREPQPILPTSASPRGWIDPDCNGWQ